MFNDFLLLLLYIIYVYIYCKHDRNRDIVTASLTFKSLERLFLLFVVATINSLVLAKQIKMNFFAMMVTRLRID